MQKVTFVPTWLAAIVISGLVASCGDDPIIKSPTTPTTPSDSVSSIEISGPASVAPGQSVQFTAIVHLSDGTTKGAGTPVVWRSSDTSRLKVASNSGIATGAQQRGEVTISAEVTTAAGVRSGTKDLVILPDGTYRVTGRVTDAEFPTFTVEDARVEFTPGSVIALTDAFGSYRAYGVPPDATMRVTADGYQAYEQSIHLTAHGSQYVQLTPLPSLALNGTYTLAFDVTDGCQNGGTLPALAVELRHRSYDAVLTQSGSDVDVTLTDPRIADDANHFRGTVLGNRATFTIESDLDFAVQVVEQLPNNTFLYPVGRAVTTHSPSGWSGQMDGSPWTGLHALINYDSQSKWLGGCLGSIRFTLTPR